MTPVCRLSLGLCCVLLSLGYLDAAGTEEFGLDETQRTKIMDDHNTYRSSLPAADMARIAWWSDGAKEAGKIVETCAEKFDTKLGRAVVAADFKSEEFVAEIKKQGEAYSDITNQCIYKAGKCEDYRQMIVGSNKMVGCAVKSCTAGTFTKADGTKEAKAVQFVVCLYPEQADTRLSKHQYTKGTHCTKCSSISPGLYCKDKLCTPIDQCKDDVTECPTAEEEKCKDAETKKKCPVKCKTCECKLECENCGKRSKEGCTCECIPGYYGGICREPCLNHSSVNCTSDTVHTCQLYTKKREMCPLLCGLCKYEDNPVCKPPPGRISLNQQQSSALIDGGREIDCRKEIWCLKGWPYLRGSICKCRCQEEWQGKLCDKSTNEAESGVILSIQGTKKEYAKIQAKLRLLIAKEMNRYCKANINICCPFERSHKSLPDDPTYTHDNRIHIGSGYPDFTKEKSDGTFELLIFAFYEPDNTLCTGSGEKSNSRKKRSVGCPVGFRKSNDKCIYDVKVPRQIIFDSLKDRRSEINKDMCCGAVVDIVTLAAATFKDYVNKRADIKTKFYDWERAIMILAIIMGGFMIWIILAIFYMNRKSRLKMELATERESKKGDNFLMRMDQAKQAKIQQEKDARIAYEREMRRNDPNWDPNTDVPAQAEVGYEPYPHDRPGTSALNGAYEHEHDCPQHRCDSPCRDVHSPELPRGASPMPARASMRSDARASMRSDARASMRSDYRQPAPHGEQAAATGGEPYRPYNNPQL